MKRTFQIVHGIKILGLQKAERLGVTLQIGVLRLIAVRALVAIGAMQRQQIVQRGRLGPGKLSFYVLQPTDQRGDFLFRLPQQRVGFLDETVEIALVGADALCLHCTDGGTFVLGGDLLHALTGKAAMVDAAIQTFFGKLGVAHLSPCLPPRFQHFGFAPVGCRHSVEHIVACLVQNTLAVFVQYIFPPLFVSPPAVRPNGTDGTHDVKVRVGNAAVLLVWLMHGEVRHHAPVHEIVQ